MIKNKKKVISSRLLVVSISILVIAIFFLVIKNFNPTFRAVSQNTGVSILIDAEGPIITIFSPSNTTFNNHSINLTYGVRDSAGISRCFFNIDNSENSTIPNCMNFTMFAFQGSHTLNLFANDSVSNLNKSSVSFSQGERHEYHYSNYSGGTTNLSNYTEMELQNFSNFILEDPNWGKMAFLENVNLTGNINLDLFTNISFNRIDLNASALPFLNRSVNFFIYELTFTNPRIAKDGVVCPETICKINNYSNGVLSFNVSSFSVFQAEETSSSGSSSGGSGGSGSVVKKVSSFVFGLDKVVETLTIGSKSSVFVNIINNGDTDLNLTVSVRGLDNLVETDQQTLLLKAKESKEVEIIFNVPEDMEPNVYTGKIIAKSGAIEKSIPIIIEVESKDPLFDVTVHIDEEFKKLNSGDTLIAEISIANVKPITLIDIEINYEIRDADGNIILSERETQAIDRHISFIKKLKIPDDLETGSYVFYVRVSYNDIITSSVNIIQIYKRTKKPIYNEDYLWWGVIIVILAVLIVANFTKLRNKGLNFFSNLFYKIKLNKSKSKQSKKLRR